MPIRKDDSGRRFVAVEVDVPGTPEEVWDAIATGPGVTSWFVPTRVELGDDGQPARVIANFGPGMESVSTVTDWQPPQSFAAESKDLGPEAPSIATEWIVEAKGGGLCTVRVVHSLFTSADDWDDQLEGWEKGWPDFFRILALYLAHFRGQRCAPVQVQTWSELSAADAWEQFCSSAGIDLAGVAAAGEGGATLQTAAEVPVLAGHVERVGSAGHPQELLVRVTDPTPGIAHVFALAMGGKTLLSVRFYLYGDVDELAEQHGARWQGWLDSLFADASKGE
ncbi:MAG: SRPBCC domain-containing protein [bacterium]|nr:SRPBCC domain-containing protein [bacterium]